MVRLSRIVVVAATMISCAARVAAPVEVPFADAHRVPLHGWVDLHTHPLSYLGFGGKAVAGGVDVGSLLPVDPDCNAHVRATTPEQALGNDVAVHGDFTAIACGDLLRNQIAGAVEKANQARGEAPAGHAADFAVWPSWDDILHQKMWVDWIQRTRDSGQRVLVALAVNSRTLGDAFSGPGDGPTDDEASADLQTSQMKAFVDRHPDIMEIAYTPTDLDRIVRSNKLAIILGMEVDGIGNFNRAGELNDVIIASEIQRLYDQGIRYLFPIHLIDNPFGGTAVYQDLFNVSNFREDGKYWDLECASPQDGIRYHFTATGFNIEIAGLKAKLGVDPFRNPPTPPACPGSGHQNKAGLTNLGKFAIKEMMRHGMLIDIDHMSQKSANQTLELAEHIPGLYPLFSGHNSMRGNHDSSENQRTVRQVQRLAALHGMLGLGSAAIDAHTWVRDYGSIAAMFSGGAISLGTDLNGLVKGSAPRPGSSVRYDATFPPSELLGHSWDYNRDGVAHYGMLADFLVDVQAEPLAGKAVYVALDQGAEYFYQTWLKATIVARHIRNPETIEALPEVPAPQPFIALDDLRTQGPTARDWFDVSVDQAHIFAPSTTTMPTTTDESVNATGLQVAAGAPNFTGPWADSLGGLSNYELRVRAATYEHAGSWSVSPLTLAVQRYLPIAPLQLSPLLELHAGLEAAISTPWLDGSPPAAVRVVSGVDTELDRTGWSVRPLAAYVRADFLVCRSLYGEVGIAPEIFVPNGQGAEYDVRYRAAIGASFACRHRADSLFHHLGLVAEYRGRGLLYSAGSAPDYAQGAGVALQWYASWFTAQFYYAFDPGPTMAHYGMLGLRIQIGSEK